MPNEPAPATRIISQPPAVRPVIRYFVWLLLMIVHVGCTVSQTELIRQEASPEVQKALKFYNALDKTTADLNQQNVVYARLKGFPYLRTNRFLSALKGRLSGREAEKAWVQSIKSLDLEARSSEIRALPEQAVADLYATQELPGQPSRQGLITHLNRNADILVSEEWKQPGFLERIRQQTDVPDDYSLAMRTFGVYPIASLPVAYFTDKAYDKMRELHQKPESQLPVYGTIIAYSPEANTSASTKTFQHLFDPSNLDPLGIPQLSGDDYRSLAESYAPTLFQDTVEDYDRIGRFTWKGNTSQLDITKPAVYYYFTHAFLNQRPIVQINYAIWYTGRRGENAPWFERGELDGMTIRISLDRKGNPFMVDIMNNCGCYHFFVPDEDRIQSIVPQSFDFDALVLGYLPEGFPEKPISVRINTGWHQVDRVGSSLEPEQGTLKTYQLIDYSELETLPMPNRQHINLFDEQGILKKSYRIEPYIFFSMGIPKVGFMRQRGHHPVKMIGRAHFDDPDLFDKNFIFKSSN